ncbi:MAG TPA: DUF5615 family PIN-like protein [Ktedonobacterales bacterium]
MKLYLDENVSRRIGEFLETEGHIVIYGQDVAHGASDTAVLALARSEGAVVITEDNDFGDLVMRQRVPSAGIVLLRLSGMARTLQPAYVAQMLVAHTDAIHGAFTVITRTLVRTRQLP